MSKDKITLVLTREESDTLIAALAVAINGREQWAKECTSSLSEIVRQEAEMYKNEAESFRDLMYKVFCAQREDI